MSAPFKPGDRVTTTMRQCLHAVKYLGDYSGAELDIPDVPLYFDEEKRYGEPGLCWIRSAAGKSPSEPTRSDNVWLVPLSSLSPATDEPTTQPLNMADWEELAKLARAAAGTAERKEELAKFHVLAHACELRYFALGFGKVLP